jgi:hypothetical protein
MLGASSTESVHREGLKRMGIKKWSLDMFKTIKAKQR